LKSTGLESGSGLWETVGMAKSEKYIPKVNDPVFVTGKGLIRYVVAVVDAKKKTVDVRTVSGVIVLTRGVPWSELSYLDESQNALRVVREATEGH
jgi:hypothetical protein